ncbi:MAG: putative membrane protein [Arenicella sp.]|jgi:uncharacterized membrane protein
MTPYLIEWLNLILRFVHVITGVAWIGASFYFVWLDNHLQTPPKWKQDKGIKGDLWSIHGGGFYEVAKYQNGPEKIPEILHWFKWEAYSTWLSGFLLLCVMYYLGAESYLIDRSVANLSQAQAIGIGLLSIFGGWLIYELLCRSKLGKYAIVLALLLLVLTSALAYGLSQLISARGMYIHIGALIGTIMAGNVFTVIMPSQRALVAAVTEGTTPDPAWGAKAKLRSTHNTYIVLPLLFIMISSHYPMTYNHQHGWLVLVCLFIITAAARWYFVLRHSNRQNILIPIGVVIATLLLIYAMSDKKQAEPVDMSSAALVGQAEVETIINTHCVGCHSSKPTDAIFTIAPAGVMLNDYASMLRWMPAIKARVVDSHNMPLMNKTNMTQQERDTLGLWIAQSNR